MKWSYVIILSILLLQSCNVLCYKQINLNKVESNEYINKKLKKKHNPYVLFVHTIDTAGSVLQTYKAVAPVIKDSFIYAMYNTADTSTVTLRYYAILKQKSIDSISKTHYKARENHEQLNQIHLTILDTVQSSSLRPNGFHENEIVHLEKISRTDERWLYAIIGILFLLENLILFLYYKSNFLS